MLTCTSGDIEINEAPNRPSGRSVIIPSSPNGNPGFPSTQMHDLTTPATASAPTFNAPISPMTAPAATPPSPSYVHGSSAPMFFTNPQSTPASPSQTPTSTTPTSNSSSLSSFNATFNLPFTSTIVRYDTARMEKKNIKRLTESITAPSRAWGRVDPQTPLSARPPPARVHLC